MTSAALPPPSIVKYRIGPLSPPAGSFPSHSFPDSISSRSTSSLSTPSQRQPSLTLSATLGNSGRISLSVPARPTPPIRAARRKSRPAARPVIKGFSPRSRATFRRQLDTTAFDFRASYAVTLPFQPATAPKSARPQYRALVKWAQRQWAGAYGYFTIEFKNTAEVHYHLILCAPAGPDVSSDMVHDSLAAKWARIAGVDPAGVYCSPVHSLGDWLAYLGKDTDQRVIPPCYAGEMTRFAGHFGTCPRLPDMPVEVPAAAVDTIREMVADIIEQQPGRRAEAVAAAVRDSSRKLHVWLSKDDLLTLKKRLWGSPEPAGAAGDG